MTLTGFLKLFFVLMTFNLLGLFLLYFSLSGQRDDETRLVQVRTQREKEQ